MRGRENEIARRYGLTVLEYESFLGKPCAICGKESQHLDHDHESGRVRAGLCSTCNQGIGSFYDNPELLEQAADYLRRYEHGSRTE